MQVSMTDSRYTVISSQNTWSNSATRIYPVFNVGLDYNDNDVYDAWEMPLAKKFCPVLFAPLEDRGLQFGVTNGFTTLRPVPVEIMDRDGPNGQTDGKLTYHDVEVDFFQSELYIGTFDMDEVLFGSENPLSNNYPDHIYPESLIFAKPPGGEYGWFIIRSHYEWATTNFPEDNVVWYSHWEQKMSAQANNTWYKDGTTYVGFDKNGNNTRINYLFHYPFNASAGRHEGDLPTIRVTISSQNPSNANIVSVSYPIHGISSVRTTKVTYDQNIAQSLAGQTFNDDGNGNPSFANKYFAISQTHPVSFGGGYLEKDGVWGFGSHAQYPCPGKWRRTKVVNFDEFVVAGGLINLETVQFNFNNYQNIKLIPPRQYVINYLRNDQNFNWLVFGGFWGHPVSKPTAGEDNLLVDLIDFIIGFFNILPFVELEIPLQNIAPLSPYKGDTPPQ
jgi:hypothetical protein